MDSRQGVTPTPGLKPRKGSRPPAVLPPSHAEHSCRSRRGPGPGVLPQRGVTAGGRGQVAPALTHPAEQGKPDAGQLPAGSGPCPRAEVAGPGDIWEITEDASNRRHIYHNCLSSVLDFCSQTQEIGMVPF